MGQGGSRVEHHADAAGRRQSAASPRVFDPRPATTNRSLLASNYVLSAIAGVIWYLQFFFYSMGQTKMGHYEFSSWTLHMASIIIFSTLWGVALQEWKGTSRKTHALIATGLAVLIASTMLVGYGNFLKSGSTDKTTEEQP
jgi:L-rhamnose-H+ transport protein